MCSLKALLLQSTPIKMTEKRLKLIEIFDGILSRVKIAS